jgi:hypothetical protein
VQCFHSFSPHLLTAQSRTEPGTILTSRFDSGLRSADSGLQLDLEIALSGVSAKVQPHRLFQSGRRCVETSGDVIEVLLAIRKNDVELYFTHFKYLPQACPRDYGEQAADGTDMKPADHAN